MNLEYRSPTRLAPASRRAPRHVAQADLAPAEIRRERDDEVDRWQVKIKVTEVEKEDEDECDGALELAQWDNLQRRSATCLYGE